ncbi:ethyl tert-butyl ether degradation [Ophiostoma piceae UAMH 11346]|uniref:Ethyl tert-butyl ether degradation n=1 Tax=Ophiostoma piceae (strain UAMH 11346) TaxID=1262450 RepID=S3C0Q7_OPHP1|nr:ethyl tert-butyl ether degradation [Ophiostoma piceae UAMH 11346]
MHSMILFLKRKDGTSVDEFYKYWEGVHGPLVKPWAERHGLTYKQIRMGAPTGPAEAVAGLQAYDGIAVFEFKDADTPAKAFSDPDFLEKVVPDQAVFLQPDASITIAGGAQTITS